MNNIQLPINPPASPIPDCDSCHCLAHSFHPSPLGNLCPDCLDTYRESLILAIIPALDSASTLTLERILHDELGIPE